MMLVSEKSSLQTEMSCTLDEIGNLNEEQSHVLLET